MKKFALGRGNKYRITFLDGKTLLYRVDGIKVYEREVGNLLGSEKHVIYGDEGVKLDGNRYVRRSNCTLEII